MISFIVETFHRLIRELKIVNQRYLYSTFNIKNRLTGLVGPRGVGKTTLLLQYIKNELYEEGKTFYFAADFVYFKQVSLLEFISELYQREGYQIFFIDEIHKYHNWNQELKNLYDAYPNMKIVFSGSSMLDLVGASYDLSRRAKMYHLHGMSFREYLNFKTTASFSPFTFDELLSNTKEIGMTLGAIDQVKSHFQHYLRMGYYPFVFEDEHSYYERIGRIVDKTIFEDIANYYKLKTPNLHCFKQLVSYLSSIPPGDINTHNLAQALKLDDKTVFHYLSILESVGLARFVYPYEGGKQLLQKPQKIFLHNTSLLHALQKYLGEEISKGNCRELFFLQSCSDAGVDLFYSPQGDFRTRNTLFEVGGKNKSKRQIRGSSQPSFLVKDDLLLPMEGVIPLFYFGFLL